MAKPRARIERSSGGVVARRMEGSIDWYFRLKGDLIHKFCEYFLMASRDGDTTPELDEGITECLWLPIPDAITTVAYDNARQIVERAAEAIESDEVKGII